MAAGEDFCRFDSRWVALPVPKVFLQAQQSGYPASDNRIHETPLRFESIGGIPAE